MKGRVLLLLMLCLCVAAPVAVAAVTGKVQGKLISSENGEPVGYADLQLIPADTTLKRVGALSNADGTFLLIAAPGRYTFQARALSYTRKLVEGVVVVANEMQSLNIALVPLLIEQKEVLVEARLRQNTENALLAARRKSSVVGDAVSAEQVRRSPDKDAAEVLRRVTGLSVSEGKYVFVRGLGERYSSTEVDGVRLASPEQNRRVVPLDLLPANLLENVVVQKTYTADRPGEFGGGDVQVRTRDFPGARTWSISTSQGYAEGVTFRQRRTYAATQADRFGFGVGARDIPGAIFDLAGDHKVVLSNNPALGFRKSALAQLAGAFRNVWTPTTENARPNTSWSVTYGDEFKLFGRSLGLIESWSLSTTYDEQSESQRFFVNETDTLYDYRVRRSTESVQLGGITGLMGGGYTTSTGVTIPLMTWDVAEFLKKEGVSFGSHTVTHAELDTLAGEDVAKQLVESRVDLREHLDVEARWLCYPRGKESPAVRESARSAGYVGAVTVKAGHPAPDTDTYGLPRAYVHSEMGMKEFEALFV